MTSGQVEKADITSDGFLIESEKLEYAKIDKFRQWLKVCAEAWSRNGEQ